MSTSGAIVDSGNGRIEPFASSDLDQKPDLSADPPADLKSHETITGLLSQPAGPTVKLNSPTYSLGVLTSQVSQTSHTSQSSEPSLATLTSQPSQSLQPSQTSQSPQLSLLGSASKNIANTANTPASNALGKSQTVFIHKLYSMLEDASLSHLIWWTANEDSFCLYPGEEFSNVLAQYFKHTNIASFIRQLNMYGFHKVNESFQTDDKISPVNSSAAGQAPAPKWEFRHSANQFRKGDVVSLSLIKRKSLKLIQSQKEIVGLKSLPPTSDAPINVGHNPLAPAYAADPHSAAYTSLQQYHRTLLQLQWDQPHDTSGTPSPKLPPRQPVYTQQTLFPNHPSYSQFSGPVLSMPVPFSPHSPRSPPPNDQPSHANPLPLLMDIRQAPEQVSAFAMEQVLNVKFLELNASVNTLKSNYKDLLSKYDSLHTLFQRSQCDLLHLTEVLEKALQKNEKPDTDESGKRENETTDFSKNRTYIDRCQTPVEKKAHNLTQGDQGTSPMSGRTQNTKVLELSTFRAQLSRKINTSTQRNQKNGGYSLNYHLHDSALSLPKISNYNIVPQQYPLNPNYGLYSSDSAIRRQVSGEEALRGAVHAPTGRHVSVLMDPLQSSPAFTKDEKLKERERERDREQAPKSLASERMSSSANLSGQTFVQQYQPLALQANPLYYQHYQIRSEPTQLRTASLPVVSNLLTPKLADHGHQRYSLTNIPDHRAIGADSESMRLLIAANTGAVAGPVLSTHSVVSSHPSQTLTSNPTAGTTFPHVDPHAQAHTQTGLLHNQNVTQLHPTPHPQLGTSSRVHSPSLVALPAMTDGNTLPKHEGVARNQLPSMEELNKSIRSSVGSGRASEAISTYQPEDSVKRRKFEN